MNTENKPIRVLWFTNTPSLAAKKFRIPLQASGSWIAASEAEIRKKRSVQLAVAFLVPEVETKMIDFMGGTYYQIQKEDSSSKSKILKRLWHQPSICKMQDLLWVIDDFKPDIIHIYGSEGSFGLIAGKVDVPVIITIQGIVQTCIQVWKRNISLTQMLFNSKLKDLLTGYGIFHEYFLFKKVSKREMVIFKRVRNYIGLTDWDKNQISILADNPNYFRLNSAIREGFFENVWEKERKAKLSIISVMSPVLYKGFDQVLDVARILKERKVSFEWRIVGTSSNSSLIDFFEKMKKTSCKENNIRFLGILDENRLIVELLKSDVYAHPSHIENSSTSVTEAMILGMPVIASFVGGMSNLIENNYNGILVPDGDSCEMAAKLLDVRDDPRRARLLGQNARKCAREKFDSQATADRLIKIYRQVLKNSNDS